MAKTAPNQPTDRPPRSLKTIYPTWGVGVVGVRLLACHARARRSIPCLLERKWRLQTWRRRCRGGQINYRSGTAVTWRGGTTATLT